MSDQNKRGQDPSSQSCPTSRKNPQAPESKKQDKPENRKPDSSHS